MYALMDTNTSTEEGYRDYRYSATLYVLSTDAGFTFSESNDIRCYQKHYDQKGFEMDETPYTDFACTRERSFDGKTLTFTIYANDSDLLVWLRGDGYGAYVNFLADTGSGLYLNLNSQGEFAAAKFLPRHLFLQAAKKGPPSPCPQAIFLPTSPVTKTWSNPLPQHRKRQMWLWKQAAPV